MLADMLNTIKRPIWLKTITFLFLLTISYFNYDLFFNVKTEYLTTDLLIFLLLNCFVLFVTYVRTQPHLSEPWQQVFKNKIAMSCSVVLTFFAIVGLMDSVHFYQSDKANPERYSVEMLSLLDSSLEYISSKTEKTYSAPFATHSYAKESVINEKGIKGRAYPRLKYGGAHLEELSQSYWSDIALKSVAGIALGLFIIALLFAGIFILKRYLRIFELDLPWRVCLYSLSIIILISSWLLYMSQYYHVMGTDKVGQDILFLTLKSIRTGLVIGTLTTLIMLPFAIALGVLAGFYKGVVDDVIQYIYTTLNSIPGILLIVAVLLAIDVYIENHADLFESAIERADLKLLALCAVLGLTSWTGLCRLLRGEVFKLRELEYVQAARALGVSNIRIILSHIVPNIMHIVLIVVVLDFSGLVLAEAVLAYIGVGVDPLIVSWGNMINSARFELAREPIVWWSLLSAFSFMFALVLAANLFSDAVRDAFDPRTQGGR